MRVVVTMAALVVACSVALDNPRPARSARPIPAFAYYYIWYQPTSWNRAKTTYPALGRYSSSDPKVIRQQIKLAKKAGLDGFIVSWKSTRRLNTRLARVVRIANEEHFKLALIYEGLDFKRKPLPVNRVESDLLYFFHRYRRNPAFGLEGRPIVIWSGTWEYPRRAIAAVSRLVRPGLLLLASEKSLDGYRRVSKFVDGDAYYWSSVDPRRDPWAGQKLAAMSQAIHSRSGLWIAPAASGFDARQVGGHRIVPRLGGGTLRAEWRTALDSTPDMIGLISWNEYSENSEVEPTLAFGTKYLSTVADLTGKKFVFSGNFDSSSTSVEGASYTTELLIGSLFVLLVCLAAAAWRREVRRAVERQH